MVHWSPARSVPETILPSLLRRGLFGLLCCINCRVVYGIRWLVIGLVTYRSLGVYRAWKPGSALTESTMRLSSCSGDWNCLRRAESGRSDRCRVELMEDSLPGDSQAARSPIVRPARPPTAALPDSDAEPAKKRHARRTAIQHRLRIGQAVIAKSKPGAASHLQV